MIALIIPITSSEYLRLFRALLVIEQSFWLIILGNGFHQGNFAVGLFLRHPSLLDPPHIDVSAHFDLTYSTAIFVFIAITGHALFPAFFSNCFGVTSIRLAANSSTAHFDF